MVTGRPDCHLSNAFDAAGSNGSSINKNRIIAAEKSGEEIRAVFDAMTDAVIVTDEKGFVVSRNPKADLFFCPVGTNPLKGSGTILEYTRNSDITALEALSRQGSTEQAVITPYGKVIRNLNVVASPLSGSGGAVIVGKCCLRRSATRRVP